MQSTFRYDVFRGTAGDTFATAGVLAFQWAGTLGVSRIIEVSVWDAPALLMMSYDGITYGPEMELDQDDPPIQIPHAARSVQIRNMTPGANSRYQVVGFW